MEPLYDFDWKTAEPQRFRPFKPAYNITMGAFAGMGGRDAGWSG